MANGITIDVHIGIPGEVAKLCLQAIEIFMNQHPELDIIGRRLPDGLIKYEFVERDEKL